MIWVGPVVSAGVLELPFPMAGPMPAWRAVFAWVGLVPLLWAVLSANEDKRPLRRSFLLGYLCGVLWYAGNCYWIYDTMLIHGGISPAGSLGILLLFSLVLGAYFGLFTLGLEVVRRRKGVGWALAAAPFLWVGLDLAASRITSVPWDQLGYSQVDSRLAILLAPVTGVYGITFVLVAVNAAIASQLLMFKRPLPRVALAVSAFAMCTVPVFVHRPQTPAATATAVLVQPNLDVAALNTWPGLQWGQHIAQFDKLAAETCKPFIDGIPETGAPIEIPECVVPPSHPDLVVWPESPAPYFEDEERFRDAMKQLALASHAPLIIGGVGMDAAEDGSWREYNSAMVFDANGDHVGRYDKIHLVPYGEFIPYRNLFFFAKKLTRKVEDLSRGTDRRVFLLTDGHGNQHRYGIFICYESVFAEEVREFAKNGAEVFVNISDDGWYGDTSAPWQHLNMARMRAIENRRWILRDTNNGVTAVIDPYGRVLWSIPRHAVDALPAGFGFRSDVTFYTAHGDVFAWACAILAIGILLGAVNARGGFQVHNKVRS